MKSRFWKVGEVARDTGVSVRTLHWYEEVGLLAPSARIDAKHRVYGDSDLQRLQQIVSMKQLGLSLKSIKSCLLDAKVSPLDVVRLHLAKVKSEKQKIESIFILLSKIEKSLSQRHSVSTDDLIKMMEVIHMQDKYFNEAQLRKIASQRKKLGDTKIKEVEAEWPRLMDAIRNEMKKGTHPNDPKVQKLAKRWDKLVNLFTGKDVDIGLRMRDMYKNEPQMRKNAGMDDELNEYVSKLMYCLFKSKK